jgi:sec-independent protein translocase protein TatA
LPFGPWEIVIILVILVLIFGASRLSQVGGALGKSVREFRGAVHEEPAAAPAPVATVPPVPPVPCPACQAPNPPMNRFCSACGATISAPAPPAAAAAAEPRPVANLTPAPEAAALDKPTSDKPEAEMAPIDRPAPMPRGVENTCPSCATVNPPGQPFCGQCGTRLTHAAA